MKEKLASRCTYRMSDTRQWPSQTRNHSVRGTSAPTRGRGAYGGAYRPLYTTGPTPTRWEAEPEGYTHSGVGDEQDPGVAGHHRTSANTDERRYEHAYNIMLRSWCGIMLRCMSRIMNFNLIASVEYFAVCSFQSRGAYYTLPPKQSKHEELQRSEEDQVSLT